MPQILYCYEIVNTAKWLYVDAAFPTHVVDFDIPHALLSICREITIMYDFDAKTSV